MLRKITGIFLIMLYTFGATEGYQLLKMPLLFQHYYQHHELNKGLSFTRFLYIHYVEPQQHDADYDQDMQLPFKSHDHYYSCINGITFIVPDIQVYFAPLLIYKNRNTFLHKNERIPNQRYSQLPYQPPKAIL